MPKRPLLAQKLATTKCRARRGGELPWDVVIGCDTVVDVDGAVSASLPDRDDARHMIRVLAGRATWCTQACALPPYWGRELCFAAATKWCSTLPFGRGDQGRMPCDRRPLRQGQGPPACQNSAAKFVAGIRGYFNVMGFRCPVALSLKELDDALDCLEPACTRDFTNGPLTEAKGQRNRKAGRRCGTVECAKKNFGG